jgi:predicted deacylase
MRRVDEYFPRDYGDGRTRFLELAHVAGFRTSTYTLPGHRAPDRGELACDTARSGSAAASKLLIIISGTHGVEGFCGSGAQAALLAAGAFDGMPADTAVLLVHAVNPYGFAHLRRTNEDNIDLNRNFIDHSRAPANPGYDEIHGWLVPGSWDGPEREQADREIERYQRERGMRAFQEAMTGGQYNHPDGLFYGGRAPAWSNVTWRRILREHCAHAREIIAFDLHTGLGPWGVGEALCVASEDEHQRAVALFGEQIKWTGAGTSVSAQVGGTLMHAAHQELGQGRLTMIGLEYGTYPIPETLEALRAETWLMARGRTDSPEAARIKQRLKDVFYVNDPAWQQAVVDRLMEFVTATRKAFR